MRDQTDGRWIWRIFWRWKYYSFFHAETLRILLISLISRTPLVFLPRRGRMRCILPLTTPAIRLRLRHSTKQKKSLPP